MRGKEMAVATHPKKKLTVAFSAAAAAVALLSFGAGTASADEIGADPSAIDATGGSGSESRGQAIHGESRASDLGVVNAHGEVRGSDIAIPVVQGQAPPPGDLSRVGYECIFAWSSFCG